MMKTGGLGDPQFNSVLAQDRVVAPSPDLRNRNKTLEMESNEKSNLKEDLSKLIGNVEFWYICASLTGLYLVVTGIQYWLPTYLKNVYGLSEDAAAIFYTSTSITGPIAGVIIGGIITQYLGGYNTYNSHRLMQVVGILAVAAAIPIPFCDFTGFAFLIWFVLFFGGFLLPQVTGIMLNSVEESKRTPANSVANLCYNLFGYLPAPSLYGMVSSIVDNPKSRIPLGFLLYTTLFSIYFCVTGINKKIAKDSKVTSPKGSLSLQLTKESKSGEKDTELMENPNKIDYASLLGSPHRDTYESSQNQFKDGNKSNPDQKYTMSPA
jgi:sugar phosphate permease